MKSVGVALVFAFACPAVADAHRLDEYLQATRVGFAGNRIVLEIDLVPGAAMASDIMTRLDRNGDGTVSPVEAAAYAQIVLGDLIVKVDERPVGLTLARVEMASLDEIRGGIGAIQLRAVGLVEGSATGSHHVYFRNDHRPGMSVYLVNALIPEGPHIQVLGQTRDPRQQEVRIDYSVGQRPFVQLLWLVFGSAGLLMLMVVRRLPGRLGPLGMIDGTT
jgi:hypothetical protein